MIKTKYLKYDQLRFDEEHYFRKDVLSYFGIFAFRIGLLGLALFLIFGILIFKETGSWMFAAMPAGLHLILLFYSRHESSRAIAARTEEMIERFKAEIEERQSEYEDG